MCVDVALHKLERKPMDHSEDIIFADSEISSELTDLFSVILYILGIIFVNTNTKAIIGSRYLIIVNGIDKQLIVLNPET